MQTVTAQQVIKKRTEALFTKSVDLAKELKEIEARAAAIRLELTEIAVEVDILEGYQDRRVVKFVREEVTITEHLGRKSVTDRLEFESSLIAIFSSNQRREMHLAEIVDQLSDMGWRWNSRTTARNYLIKQGLVEKVRHGVFKLIQDR